MPALLAGATAFSAVSSVAGGFAANSAASEQARLQQQQGELELQNAQANATNEAYNQNQAIGKQRLAFLANGVTLEGSPAIVQSEATRYGQTQVDVILKQGAAKYNLAQAQATQTKNAGRAALIAGFGQAVGTTASGINKSYEAGVFDTKKKAVT